MKTILVIADHPELMESMRAVLNPEQYRVIGYRTVEQAEPMLGAGFFDACVLDVELADARGAWTLEALMRRVRSCPVIIFTGSRSWEWEEEAYLKGVAYVLSKPVRGRMLNALLERFCAQGPAAVAPVIPHTTRAQLPRKDVTRPTEALYNSAQSLHMVGEFSSILTHSLDAEAMLRQFLMLVREILGVNRAAIFLRRPVSLFWNESRTEASPQLRSAYAIGLAAGLLEHFQLSFEAGIGGYVFREGRILRREAAEALGDVQAQKEFELLGSQVAIPILDRETAIGVAVLDWRVTGEALTNEELAIIFHLLEELGLAVKNIWLHEQLAGNHELLANILRELSSACVVIGRDLTVLHANKMARNLFGQHGRRSGELEFNDLPQVIGSKIYQVLQTGSSIIPFKFTPPNSPGNIYQVCIVPFHKADVAVPGSALLMVDDLTQSEQFKRLEVEAGNLRLVRTMSERLAHEINNAVMPLDTYQQVMKKELKDLPPSVKNSDFWISLSNTLAEGVKRISRRGAQMRMLAQDALVSKQVMELEPILQDAYQEAQKHHSAQPGKLNVQGSADMLMVSGDKEALKLAFSEILLNALQANPKEMRVIVRVGTEKGSDGVLWGKVEIQDNGSGFSAEALENACKPFYRTKVIGLGLGLTVAEKIIALHEGKLSLSNASGTTGGCVRVALPLDASSLKGEA